MKVDGWIDHWKWGRVFYSKRWVNSTRLRLVADDYNLSVIGEDEYDCEDKLATLLDIFQKRDWNLPSRAKFEWLKRLCVWWEFKVDEWTT